MDAEHIRHHVQFKHGSANGAPIAPLADWVKKSTRDKVEEVFKMTKIDTAAAGKKLIKGLPLITESEVHQKEPEYIVNLVARRAAALTVELPRMPILWGYSDCAGGVYFSLEKRENIAPISKLEFYLPPEEIEKKTPAEIPPNKEDIEWAHDVLTRAAKLGVRE